MSSQQIQDFEGNMFTVNEGDMVSIYKAPEEKGEDGEEKEKKKAKTISNNTTSSNVEFKQGTTDYVELGVDNIATGTETLSESIKKGLIFNRKTLGLHHKINGSKPSIGHINRISNISKSGSYLGRANLFLSAYNAYDDINSYESGDISEIRLGYKLGTGVSALYIGSIYGGIPGTVAGTTAVALEMSYDVGHWWLTQVAYFNTQVEKALKSGWFPISR